MHITTNPSFSKYHNSDTIRSNLRHVFIPLSLVVILLVFWGLKLTGITMADEAFCGMDEHIHGEHCPTGELICDLEETDGHVHKESCILRELRCEQAEVLPHVHDEACQQWALICPMDELEAHMHGDSCRKQTLICSEEEREGHAHDDSCFISSMCCTEESAEHVHTPDCYEALLACEAEEVEGHTHDEACFLLEEAWSCGLEETDGHTHLEECYAPVEDSFLCGLEETDGHAHMEECYYTGIGFGCGLTEAEGHIHTEECLTEETELGCGMEYIPAHIHVEECYTSQDVCPLEEHIHVESCYSDIHADLESEDDWEAEMDGLEESTTTGKMVASVALSQLGYGESERNFQVDSHGVRRGITRYGQWYGNPYGDWSAMFVSFCLHYAGVEDLPANAGVESMRLEWEAEGLYRLAEEYLPCIGDLVFLLPEVAEVPQDAQTLDEENIAATVAIIADVDDDRMIVIQGDVNGKVEERSIQVDDAAILGYGLVPERSPYAMTMSPFVGEKSYLASSIGYYDGIFTNYQNFVIYAQASDGQYYALISEAGSTIQARANTVPIQIMDGEIYLADPDIDPNLLLWNFTSSNENYIIKNVGNGRLFHTGSDPAVLFPASDNWETAVLSGNNGGVRFVHTLRNNSGGNWNFGIRFDQSAKQFYSASPSGNASTFYLGAVEQCTVVLDGSQGDLMSLRGSPLESRAVAKYSSLTLPSAWESPRKYSYLLKGWYDVNHHEYYQPGETIEVSENMLLYADWTAATYDIGYMNEHVVNTVSTENFITTRVFDYNSLFNTLSQNNDYRAEIGGESTEWTLIEDGTVANTGKDTLNFIFMDHDSEGQFSNPNERNDENGVVYEKITQGLYHQELANLLFDPDVDVIGKQYVGTGDYLFQYGADPLDGEHYGYYYYDSKLNAASYNQTNQRFYVYDYLERTTDSPGNDSYADFLPFNSPYANTNGRNIGTYSYNGQIGYYYDARYSGDENSENHIATNFANGMAIEINFYLSARPGATDENGKLPNQSITGDNMIFEFSGDDDVWILIDDELVLDIGGIHLAKGGSIDFSTGDVKVQLGTDDTYTTIDSVIDLKPGERKLTMYYLERGASMSNFKLRFNLATRYSMTLRKEDTLEASLLDGAKFAVYTDESCLEKYAAHLWPSREAYERDENGTNATNVFEVKNGQAKMWGFAAGNTYYLVEILGPDSMQGVPAQGIIRLRLNNDGMPDYEVLPDHSDNLTVGYTVYGYKVNEELQEAYLRITNTDATDSEPTEVTVEKVWNDTKDHSRDEVTAYLVANGIRIQEVVLNEANDWKHKWVNLPSTDRDGKTVIYTIHESTFPGYVSSVTGAREDAGGTVVGGTVTNADGFEKNQAYLLHTNYGYLSATGGKLYMQSDAIAAAADNSCLWTASLNSDGTMTLTNKAGQTLFWNNGDWSFRASAYPTSDKNFRYENRKLYIAKAFEGWNATLYPGDNSDTLGRLEREGYLPTETDSARGLIITPQIFIPAVSEPPDTGEEEEPERDFIIINTPANEATVSLRVHKLWDLGSLGDSIDYRENSVVMDLLANGKDAGLSGTLNLRNGWSYTFRNLPKYDSSGDEIAYSVREAEANPEWYVQYGPITAVNGSTTAYETTVTNVYRTTPMLPSTGSFGRQVYVMTGLSIIVGGMVWYRRQKRKDERRKC